MKKGTAFVMILLLILSLCAAAFAGEAGGEKKPTMIELMQQLSKANSDMWTRDRAGDMPIYQIDADRFVSEEDITALMNVLAARHALQMTMNTGNKLPSEEDARYLLIGELLLTAEADALGLDIKRDLMYYQKEGWLEPEPPTPDASDTESLVRQGLIRIQLRRNDLTSAQDTKLPYQGSVPLIDALVETLYAKYPSTVPYVAAAVPKSFAYSDPSLGLAFDPPEGWVRADAAGGVAAFLAPDESGIILVAPSGSKVDAAMAEGFTIDIVTEWMRAIVTEGELTDIEPLLFAKTVDADGKLYVLAECGCMVEDTPFIYAMYFFTSPDNTLTGVVGISVNNDAGAVTRAWFDEMIMAVIPAEPLAALLAEI